MRKDFTINDPEEEEQLVQAFNEKYLGGGEYRLETRDFVSLFIKVSKEEKIIVNNLINEVVVPVEQHKNASDYQPKEQLSSVKEFLNNQDSNVSKALRRQIEYYFSDSNYSKDRYILDRVNSDGYIALKEIMSFNKMRKLTKSAE